MGIFLLSLNIFEITDFTQKRGRERGCAARHGIIECNTNSSCMVPEYSKSQRLSLHLRTKVKMTKISRKKGGTHLT